MDGMMEKGRTEPAGSPKRSQEAGGGEPAGGPPSQRFSAKRKLRAVNRLLRGDPLELVARELNVTAARLSAWRDRALLAAEAAPEKAQEPLYPAAGKKRRRDGNRTRHGAAARARAGDCARGRKGSHDR